MLIKNANVITWGDPNQILEDHGIYIEDGLIRELGPTDELAAQHNDTESIDARGQYVMPATMVVVTIDSLKPNRMCQGRLSDDSGVVGK